MKRLSWIASGVALAFAVSWGAAWWEIGQSYAHDEIRAEIAPMKVSACTICLNDCWNWCPQQINPPMGCQEWCTINPCSGVC